MKAKGYSLCLVPDKGSEVYGLLQRLIYKAAVPYKTPVFEPHVTLMGNIEGTEKELCEKTRALAENLKPYEIKLNAKSVGSNGIYFQILFFPVEQTLAVMNANAAAQKIFAMREQKYFPHLSLAYGDLSESQVAVLRELIAREYLNREIKFIATNVELENSEGEVHEWREVATFPFGKS